MSNTRWQIRNDDLSAPEVISLITEHIKNMYEVSPPESVHALGVDSLRAPGVTFWSAWEGGELLGCGALKELDPRHGEIKSMRTVTAHLRKGVAARLLQHILDEARCRSYARLSLETGSQPDFDPARALYARFGFEFCGPFAEYTDDPNSVFMTLRL